MKLELTWFRHVVVIKILSEKRNMYMIKSKHINLNLLDLLTPSSVSKKSKCNLTTRDFQTYFKSVNYPESICYQPDDDVLYFNDRYLNGELDGMFT